jgi:hypothetical protein
MESVVGNVYVLKLPLLNNRRGTLGVCYRTSSTEYGEEMHLVFPNAEWDSFNDAEALRFLNPVGKSPAIAGYKCVEEEKMKIDFDRGVFSHIWARGIFV